MINERKAKQLLEASGWEVERRVRGQWTHDFFERYDLIAMHPVHGWKLVQVTSNVNKPPEFREFLALHKVPPGTSKEIWIWYDRVKEPRIIVL